jgi:hypothetical protein
VKGVTCDLPLVVTVSLKKKAHPAPINLPKRLVPSDKKRRSHEVHRFTESSKVNKLPKVFDIKKGKGTKLGDCPNVTHAFEELLNKTPFLVTLHNLVYFFLTDYPYYRSSFRNNLFLLFSDFHHLSFL